MKMNNLGYRVSEIPDTNQVLDELEEQIRLRTSGEIETPYKSQIEKFRLKWGEDYPPRRN